MRKPRGIVLNPGTCKNDPSNCLCDDHEDMTPGMSFDDVMHWIAQASININEGLGTIEAGSPVHRAMERLCEFVTKRYVGLK